MQLAQCGSNVQFVFFKLFSSNPHPHSKNNCSTFEENPTSFSCCWFTCREQREYFSISLTTFSIIGEFNYIFLHPDSSFSHHQSRKSTCWHWTQIFWTKLQVQGFFRVFFVIISIISGHLDVSLKVMDKMCVWTYFFVMYFFLPSFSVLQIILTKIETSSVRTVRRWTKNKSRWKFQ